MLREWCRAPDSRARLSGRRRSLCPPTPEPWWFPSSSRRREPVGDNPRPIRSGPEPAAVRRGAERERSARRGSESWFVLHVEGWNRDAILRSVRRSGRDVPPSIEAVRPRIQYVSWRGNDEQTMVGIGEHSRYVLRGPGASEDGGNAEAGGGAALVERLGRGP